MDPNETLRRLRANLAEVWGLCESWPLNLTQLDRIQGLACEYAELFEALDTWILHGGALPSDWRVNVDK